MHIKLGTCSYQPTYLHVCRQYLRYSVIHKSRLWAGNYIVDDIILQQRPRCEAQSANDWPAHLFSARMQSFWRKKKDKNKNKNSPTWVHRYCIPSRYLDIYLWVGKEARHCCGIRSSYIHSYLPTYIYIHPSCHILVVMCLCRGRYRWNTRFSDRGFLPKDVPYIKDRNRSASSKI